MGNKRKIPSKKVRKSFFLFFFLAASFHTQYSYFSTMSPQVRFFEFLPNRWEGIFSTQKKKRVTHKRGDAEKGQDACLCVWGCGGFVQPTKTHKIQQAGARYHVSVRCLLPGPRLAEEWLRASSDGDEELNEVCFTLNPLWKSLEEKCSTYPAALQRPAPNYPPTKLLKKHTKVSDRPERLMLPRNVWQRTGRLWKERSVWTCLPSFNIWKRGSGKQMPLDWKQLLSWRNMVLNRAVCAKTSKNVTRWRVRCWRDTDMLHHDWQASSNYTHH